MTGDETRFTLTRIGAPSDFRDQMKEDVRAGLTAPHKSLPSTYFYDDYGSALFAEITQLPEYYLTRAETEILEAHAHNIIAATQPEELVEIGAGYAQKTQVLLSAIHASNAGSTYVAIDVSESALLHAGQNLTSRYPWLTVKGYLADFGSDLASVPRNGRRLVAFLGSTLGNLAAEMRPGFFRAVASMLDGSDAFLLGVDLIKEESTLLAAYDDSAGLSAAFNKNILVVINRELGGDIDIDAFKHTTTFYAESGCMEQSLLALRDVSAHLHGIGLDVQFAQGESIHTEWSCKFTREQVESELSAAGLDATHWWTDSEKRFALTLARRSSLSAT